MTKVFNFGVILIAFFLFSLISCTRDPLPSLGLERYNNKQFRYLIDYPKDSCEVYLDSNKNVNLYTIIDKNRNYKVEILSIKTENDKRYKFDYYPIVDTLFHSKIGTKSTETADFLTDIIYRTYVNNDFTIETKSIYGGSIIYIIYTTYNTKGQSAARNIAQNFRRSSGVGVINFCKRKLYAIFGDGILSEIISYTLFSLCLTFLFFGGLYFCFQFKAKIFSALTIVLFVLFFSAFACSEEFMGYIYGHNSLLKLILSVLILFCDEG